MAMTEHVEAVRAFNRFYTARMGLTRGTYARPLPEVRVMYELAHGTEEVAELARALEIDAGQLSRVLSRARGAGTGHAANPPRSMPAGSWCGSPRRAEERFAEMDEDSADAIGAVLDDLGDAAAVVAAMTQLKRAIEPEGTLTLREFEPGDLGWMVQRHGALYAREYGWDQSFERLVARIAADFDPTTDRGWVAEIDGDKVGTIMCVHQDETTAKLRTLLVEPKARGRGVGGRSSTR